MLLGDQEADLQTINTSSPSYVHQPTVLTLLMELKGNEY